jgi:maltose alpha-D-glucosyltransferase/alpha-amylase
MAAFAPREEMRAYGGIRRRLASMLGDDRRVAMAHAIVQSLPGVPIVRYGEEIGMVEDLSLPDRMSVRTPMEWDKVAEQELRTGSLLSRVSQLVHRRRELGALPVRGCEPLEFDRRSVLGLLHHRDDGALLMLVNLSDDQVELRLPYDVEADLLADGNYLPATRECVRLAGYGYRWLRLSGAETHKEAR